MPILYNDKTDSKYMTFYIKDYVFYTEIEKDTLMMRAFEQNPFVHITLGGDKQSEIYLEIIGDTAVVTDQDMIDWLREKEGLVTVASEMAMLRVLVQRVRLGGISEKRMENLKEA
ncbi:hypothetical protein [Salinicoccus albus]|uniref:hypothetical protein n=1 Tax=Salinicoccus albus TaxID=418756 RepID=UPI00036EE92A|nr:hypothetical protein [Salinicoccus albus]